MKGKLLNAIQSVSAQNNQRDGDPLEHDDLPDLSILHFTPFNRKSTNHSATLVKGCRRCQGSNHSQLLWLLNQTPLLTQLLLLHTRRYHSHDSQVHLTVIQKDNFTQLLMCSTFPQVTETYLGDFSNWVMISLLILIFHQECKEKN